VSLEAAFGSTAQLHPACSGSTSSNNNSKQSPGGSGSHPLDQHRARAEVGPTLSGPAQSPGGSGAHPSDQHRARAKWAHPRTSRSPAEVGPFRTSTEPGRKWGPPFRAGTEGLGHG